MTKRSACAAFAAEDQCSDAIIRKGYSPQVVRVLQARVLLSLDIAVETSIYLDVSECKVKYLIYFAS